MTNMTRIISLTYAYALLFTACYQTPSPQSAIKSKTKLPKSEPVAAIVAQTLGPNDVFEIRVFNHPELSQVYRVSPNGKILFPLIGELAVANQTASQVANSLQKRLEHDYLLNPQISIFVKEYNSKKVSVFGEVSKPGTFAYNDGMNIIQAITMAGGFTKLASENIINVTRVVNKSEIRLTVRVDAILSGTAKNFSLQPGDIVYVPESIF